MASKAPNKPHAVCIPLPYQSHITSMMKLAKLLHHKGYHITFVHTEYTYSRLLQSRGPDSLNGLPGFRFEKILDTLPPLEPDSPQRILMLAEAIGNGLLLPPFIDLLVRLNGTESSGVPSVTCIISDGLMDFTTEAAQELGIPIALFFTISASSFMLSTQFAAVRDKGLLPVEDESFLTNDYLDKVVDGIPGMKDIRLRDFRRVVRSRDPKDTLFNGIIHTIESAHIASAIILHTFEALEQGVLNALYSMFRRVYPVGPLQLHLNQLPQYSGSSIGSNLWKEEPECLQWLDSREPNSVVLVNFGSVILISKHQFIELGMGMANSKIPFLWIIRPHLVIGDSTTLPPEFFEATEGNGLIASWCPQEDVLNHPSIGGFLTHSGWGSTIESISSRVPMLCWPRAGDQHIVCRYTCKEWGIGLELDSDINRENVEKLVRELMVGEKGKAMKNKAMEWKKLAEEATGPSGSSSRNLDKLEEVLSKHARCK